MAEAVWYYAKGNDSVGPVTLDELVKALPGAAGDKTLIFGPGLADWTAARHVGPVIQAARGGSAGSRPPMPPKQSQSDVIDYEIFGEEMQFVEVTLDPGETVIAEAGSMMYMTDGIEMQTVFGDPSASGKQGFFGKLVTAGKRMLTGESLFMTTFTNQGRDRHQVAFASPYPGKIVPLHLDQLGGEIQCQKDAFICAAKGVQVGIAFTKKFGAGIFGGEGFIMQKLSGDGIALVHAGGTLVRRELAAGERIRLDTGCLVALTPSVDYDIQMQKGIKNTLFGGEGLFLATVTGPGVVWFQSLPFSRLAGRIHAAAGGGKEEGSILGGLGNLLDGDNS